MSTAPIIANGRTESDGTLHLTLDVGVPDSDVTVEVRVVPKPKESANCKDERDANGWPIGFFERVAGSMPDLKRWPQGEFEERLPL